MTTHRGRPSWTGERQAELERLWNGNATLKEMGKRFGVSGSAVCNQARKMGLTLRVEQMPPWDDLEDHDLIDMAAKGLTTKDISKLLGRSTGAVQRRKTVLRQAGKMPPPVIAEAPEYLAKPRVVTERKVRKCLHCRETFESEHRGNWICQQCAPIVNRLRSGVA